MFEEGPQCLSPKLWGHFILKTLYPGVGLENVSFHGGTNLNCGLVYFLLVGGGGNLEKLAIQ